MLAQMCDAIALALVLAASSRQLVSDLRLRSGTLPSSGEDSGARKRSRLGMLVDPLGLFRNSAILNPDDRDRAALHAAAKLASLSTELGLLGSRHTLAEAQRGELTRVLVSRVWERRSDLRHVLRRVTREYLEQAASRKPFSEVS